MKINPISNYQINRGQKAQAKSNPIFEGVRFVPDRALAEKYLSNNGQITSKSLRKIGAKFKNINDYVNKKILPMVLAKKIMPYVNNNTVFPDNVKNIEDLAKFLWPEDTDVKINCEIEETYWPKHFTTIKFFDCINGNNPLIETTFKDFYRFENNRSGLNDILTIFAGAILKNSHEFDSYSARLDDWLSMINGNKEDFHTNNLENLLSTLIEHQPEFKSFIKQLEDTAKLATQSNLENLENSIKNCEQKEIDSNNTKDIESKSLSGIKPTPLLAEGSALKAWLGDEFEDYINSVIKNLFTKFKNNKLSSQSFEYELSKLIRKEIGSSIESLSLIKEAKKAILESKAKTLILEINNNEISIADAKKEVVKLSKEKTEGSTDVVSRIEEAIKNKAALIEEAKKREAALREAKRKENAVNLLIDKIYDGVPFSDIEKELSEMSQKYNDDSINIVQIFKDKFELKLNQHKKRFNITTGAKFNSSYTKLMEKLKGIYSKEEFEKLENDINNLAPILDDQYIIVGDLKTNNILLKHPKAKKQVVMRCEKDADSNQISHSIDTDGNIYKFAESANQLIDKEKISFLKNISSFKLDLFVCFGIVVLYPLIVLTMALNSPIENKDKSVQDESTDKTEIVTKPTEDARMQQGDINYEEEMEPTREEMESMRQQAEQQIEQARQEMEDLRKNFRF